MLETLVDKIEPYNSFGLLSTMGALQLSPQNLHHATRIEALTYATCCLEYDTEKPKMSNHRLNRILTSDPLGQKGQIAMFEDPCNNLFTESITFFGGSYTVFPGILETPTHILKHLNTARGRSSINNIA